MTLRKGVYIVPTDRWYIERTVWLIAGFVLLAFTAMALLVTPLWILGVTGNRARLDQRLPYRLLPGWQRPAAVRLQAHARVEQISRWYFMQTDKWYLERRIYVAVGFNISVASHADSCSTVPG